MRRSFIVTAAAVGLHSSERPGISTYARQVRQQISTGIWPRCQSSFCVTASPGHQMETALKEAGKEPRSDYYNFRGKKQDRKVEIVPTAAKPLVYYLFGDHDDRQSMVLTEMDLIDYLVQIVKGEPPIPDTVRSILADNDSSFLFLGFGFHNWYSRVLLKVLNVYGHNDKPIAFEDPEFFHLPEHPQTTKFFSEDFSGDVFGTSTGEARRASGDRTRGELLTFPRAHERFRRQVEAGPAVPLVPLATQARTALLSICYGANLKRTASGSGGQAELARRGPLERRAAVRRQEQGRLRYRRPDAFHDDGGQRRISSRDQGGARKRRRHGRIRGSEVALSHPRHDRPLRTAAVSDRLSHDRRWRFRTELACSLN